MEGWRNISHLWNNGRLRSFPQLAITRAGSINFLTRNPHSEIPQRIYQMCETLLDIPRVQSGSLKSNSKTKQNRCHHKQDWTLVGGSYTPDIQIIKATNYTAIINTGRFLWPHLRQQHMSTIFVCDFVISVISGYLTKDYSTFTGQNCQIPPHDSSKQTEKKQESRT